MGMKNLIIPLLTLVLTACGGGGSPSSSPSNPVTPVSHGPALLESVQFNTVNTVYNSAVGDLNGDGLEDVVVGGWYASSATSHIWVFIQNADGSMTDSTQTFLGTTTYTGSQHVFIADFDNDGKNDIWLPGFQDGNGAQPTTSTMYWGTGANTQFTQQSFADLVTSHGACVDDVNNDGKLDMIVAGGGIYFNNGSRSFTLDQTILHGNNYFAACAVMHQANGDVDIFLSNNNAVAGYNDNINVYDNSLNFQTAVGVTKPPVDSNSDTIDAISIDVNGDGQKDLIAIRNGSSGNGGNGRDIYLNTGNDTFTFNTNLDPTLGNDYYTYKVTVDGNPMILFSGGDVTGTKLYQINNGLTVYDSSAFTNMASGFGTAPVAAVYRNATYGKSYMLQLLDTSFYTQALQ
jgi:hypothetical protein